MCMSMKEIETKIIDIEETQVRRSLKNAGAKFHGKFSLLRYVFFVGAPHTGPGIDEFVRVRTDGKNSTLTYKYRKGKGLANTDEIEVNVDDFEKTVQILSRLFKGRRPWRQESKLEKWTYKGAEVCICTWPLIPSFVEVEASSEKKVMSTIKELKIKGKVFGNRSFAEVFGYYGKEGLDAGSLKF